MKIPNKLLVYLGFALFVLSFTLVSDLSPLLSWKQYQVFFNSHLNVIGVVALIAFIVGPTLMAWGNVVNKLDEEKRRS